ncbi:MAG: dockerin type I repeat-containing protein [Armatimonadota bacterium]
MRKLALWFSLLTVAASLMLPMLAFAAPIIGVRKGDVDGDGRVTVRDAQICLMIVVGKIRPTPSQIAACDVAPKGRPDGRVTVGDAVVINRMAVGLE